MTGLEVQIPAFKKIPDGRFEPRTETEILAFGEGYLFSEHKNKGLTKAIKRKLDRAIAAFKKSLVIQGGVPKFRTEEDLDNFIEGYLQRLYQEMRAMGLILDAEIEGDVICIQLRREMDEVEA